MLKFTIWEVSHLKNNYKIIHLVAKNEHDICTEISLLRICPRETVVDMPNSVYKRMFSEVSK
jgi:hypothetical protein